MIRTFFESIGRYFLFLKMVFRKPEKGRIFWRQFVNEADKLILSSILLVGVISLFIGGVLVIQTASNLENPIIDKMYIGYMVRESLILEFCSTMVALILAGKMGSNISSEIGSMRITEQIDAMDMMGVNSAGFLVLPKVTAATILSPLLMLLSLALGLVGGYVVVESTQIIPTASYITGIKALMTTISKVSVWLMPMTSTVISTSTSLAPEILMPSSEYISFRSARSSLDTSWAPRIL